MSRRSLANRLDRLTARQQTGCYTVLIREGDAVPEACVNGSDCVCKFVVIRTVIVDSPADEPNEPEVGESE